MAGLTGGYYWLPSPGDVLPTWDVVTRHDLGFDAEAGRVEFWDAAIERLATAWGKDAAVLGRLLRNHPHGLPRGRVTRPGRRFLILHGDDWPCPDGLERVMVAFGLDRRLARALFDEHERTIDQERRLVARALGVATP